MGGVGGAQHPPFWYKGAKYGGVNPLCRRPPPPNLAKMDPHHAVNNSMAMVSDDDEEEEPLIEFDLTGFTFRINKKYCIRNEESEGSDDDSDKSGSDDEDTERVVVQNRRRRRQRRMPPARNQELADAPPTPEAQSEPSRTSGEPQAPMASLTPMLAPLAPTAPHALKAPQAPQAPRTRPLRKAAAAAERARRARNLGITRGTAGHLHGSKVVWFWKGGKKVGIDRPMARVLQTLVDSDGSGVRLVSMSNLMSRTRLKSVMRRMTDLGLIDRIGLGTYGANDHSRDVCTMLDEDDL
jgi:hypothetical protein